MIDVQIVVVSWNTRDLLLACLRSVFVEVADTTPEQIQVWVIDNASTDGSAEAVRQQFPKVAVVENDRNVGFAAANNQALRACRAQAHLLLNSDTVVVRGALRRLLDSLHERPQAGAFGPRLLNLDGTLQFSAYPMLTPGRELWRLLFLDQLVRRGSYPMHRWRLDHEHRVEVLTGACLLLRRDALDQVGLLDETYFMYTEEVDLCQRLAQAGWEIWWEPRAQVVHYGQASSAHVARDMYLQLYRSKVQFFRKFGGEARATRFKRFIGLAYWPRLIAAAAGSLLSPPLRSQAVVFQQLLRQVSEF